MKDKKAGNLRCVVILLVIIAIVIAGACIAFFWCKSKNTKEQIKNINYYFDLTLPEGSEIAKYNYIKQRQDDTIMDVPDVSLNAKVIFSKSKYESFISSIRDYADRSDIPGDYGGYDVSWWDYDESKVKDAIEILEDPKDFGENGERKITAMTNIVVVENGNSYEVYMCYLG